MQIAMNKQVMINWQAQQWIMCTVLTYTNLLIIIIIIYCWACTFTII